MIFFLHAPVYIGTIWLFQITTITSIHHNPPHNKIYGRHNIHNNQNEEETDNKMPYFDDEAMEGGNRNITVMQSENAYLDCIVRNLGSNTISWLRHSNINLLSVGKFKYSQDPRYQIFHNAHNDTWTFKVSQILCFLINYHLK